MDPLYFSVIISEVLLGKCLESPLDVINFSFMLFLKISSNLLLKSTLGLITSLTRFLVCFLMGETVTLVMFSFNLLPSLFNISTFTVFACLSSILDFQGSKYVD